MPRAWIPNSGWPFGKDELLPFYARGHQLLQINVNEYGTEFWKRALARQRLSLFPIEGDDVINVIDLFSPPTRFGQRYQSELEAADNVQVFLNANVTELETDSSGSVLERVHVATLNGVRFCVSPRAAVLSTGGIENARILLASRRHQANGIGNGHDLVGRYFTDHPRLRSIRVDIANREQHRRVYDSTLSAVRGGARLSHLPIAAHLGPSARLQGELSLPNFRTYLTVGFADAVASVYIALKAIRQKTRGRRKFGAAPPGLAREIGRNLPTLLRHGPRVAVAAMETLLGKQLVHRDFYLETVIEPIPNPDSRVMLSSQRDRLGMNQVRLDWRLTEQDRENFTRIQRLVVDQMSRAGIFLPKDSMEKVAEVWPAGIRGCWHHMGTTRMHANPRQGVVDPDCRVHGMHNLFVAGSSVFPSFGSDLPTLTVVALAVRLANRISRALQSAKLEIEEIAPARAALRA